MMFRLRHTFDNGNMPSPKRRAFISLLLIVAMIRISY